MKFPQSELAQMLQQIVTLKGAFKREQFRWSGVEELLLDPLVASEWYRNEPSLEYGELQEELLENRNFCLPKACFRNAAMAALMNPQEIEYIEGFASDESIPIPIHHAWNRLPDGTIVDCTWCGQSSRVKLKEAEYIGVAVPIPFLLDLVQKNQNIVVFDWPTIVPIMENPPDWLFIS